jgi:nickel-dependent lactate racemase
MNDLQTVCMPYGEAQIEFSLPRKNLLAVASPRSMTIAPDPRQEILRSVNEPIAAPLLREVVRGAERVVILADDLTRMTPVELMIPVLLDEFNCAGVKDDQIRVVIALGTHRAMTQEEIEAHFGCEVIHRVEVVNNPWQDPAEMVDLGSTANGTPVSVSRMAKEADFLIGVGSIVPHHIPGFSGGAKIVQPGITGARTTGATHYLSTRAELSYLGQAENPVRLEMEQIAAQVGLKAILNVVLNPAGQLVRSFYGDPVVAHRAGIEVSRQVYGVALPGKADIVIAGSHPCDIEFWQAHKSLYAAEIALKTGGTIIVVTPCPEGVSVVHHGMLDFTALDAQAIEAKIVDGTISDTVSGALALAWAKVRRGAQVSLVSGGISAAEARALGFTPYDSVEQALAAALLRHGQQATVTVLTHAPDSLPILQVK